MTLKTGLRCFSELKQKMKNKDKIWIEKQDYTDRTEFRIKIKGKYPPGLNRKGFYEMYLSFDFILGNVTHHMEHLFEVNKNVNWFAKLLYGDYNAQCKTAIRECNKLIKEEIEDNEQPEITKLGIREQKTKDELISEWADHMTGEKISPRLKKKGVGLKFGGIKKNE